MPSPPAAMLPPAASPGRSDLYGGRSFDPEDELAPEYASSSRNVLHALQQKATSQAAEARLRQLPIPPAAEAEALLAVRHCRSRRGTNLLVLAPGARDGAPLLPSAALAAARAELNGDSNKPVVLYHAFGDPAFSPSLPRVLASLVASCRGTLHSAGIPLQAARQYAELAKSIEDDTFGRTTDSRPTPPWAATTSRRSERHAAQVFAALLRMLSHRVPVYVLLDNVDAAAFGGIDSALLDCLPVDLPTACRVVLRISSGPSVDSSLVQTLVTSAQWLRDMGEEAMAWKDRTKNNDDGETSSRGAEFVRTLASRRHATDITVRVRPADEHAAQDATKAAADAHDVLLACVPPATAARALATAVALLSSARFGLSDEALGDAIAALATDNTGEAAALRGAVSTLHESLASLMWPAVDSGKAKLLPRLAVCPFFVFAMEARLRGCGVSAPSSEQMRSLLADLTPPDAHARVQLWQAPVVDIGRTLFGTSDAANQTLAAMWDDMESRDEVGVLLTTCVAEKRAVSTKVTHAKDELTVLVNCQVCGTVAARGGALRFCHACGSTLPNSLHDPNGAIFDNLDHAYDKLLNLEAMRSSDALCNLCDDGDVLSELDDNRPLIRQSWQVAGSQVRGTILDRHAARHDHNLEHTSDSPLPHRLERKALLALGHGFISVGRLLDGLLCMLASACVTAAPPGNNEEEDSQNALPVLAEDMHELAQTVLILPQKRDFTIDTTDSTVRARQLERLVESANALDAAADIIGMLAMNAAHDDDTWDDAERLEEHSRACVMFSQNLRSTYFQHAASMPFNVLSEFPYFTNSCPGTSDGEAAQIRAARRIAHTFSSAAFKRSEYLCPFAPDSRGFDVTTWVTTSGKAIQAKVVLQDALARHRRAIAVLEVCIDGLDRRVRHANSRGDAQSDTRGVWYSTAAIPWRLFASCDSTSWRDGEAADSLVWSPEVPSTRLEQAAHDVRAKLIPALSERASGVIPSTDSLDATSPQHAALDSAAHRALRTLVELEAAFADMAVLYTRVAHFARLLAFLEQLCGQQPDDFQTAVGTLKTVVRFDALDGKPFAAEAPLLSLVASESRDADGLTSDARGCAMGIRDVAMALVRTKANLKIHRMAPQLALAAAEASVQAADAASRVFLGNLEHHANAFTLAAVMSKARIHQSAGDHKGFVQCLTDSLKALETARRSSVGPAAPPTRTASAVAYALGRQCLVDGEPQLASALLHKAALGLAAQSSLTSQTVLYDLLLLDVVACFDQDRPSDAEALLWRCLRMQTETAGHRTRAELLALLARSLLAQDKPRDAAQLLREAIGLLSEACVQFETTRSRADGGALRLVIHPRTEPAGIAFAVCLCGPLIHLLMTQHMLATSESQDAAPVLDRAAETAFEVISRLRSLATPTSSAECEVVRAEFATHLLAESELHLLAPTISRLGRELQHEVAPPQTPGIRLAHAASLPTSSRKSLAAAVDCHRKATNALLRASSSRVTCVQRLFSLLQRNPLWLQLADQVRDDTHAVLNRFIVAVQDTACDAVIDTALALCAMTPESHERQAAALMNLHGRKRALSADIVEALELCLMALESGTLRFDDTSQPGMPEPLVVAVRRAYVGYMYSMQRRDGDALRTLGQAYRALAMADGGKDADVARLTIGAWLDEVKARLHTSRRLRDVTVVAPLLTTWAARRTPSIVEVKNCTLIANRFRVGALRALWRRAACRLMSSPSDRIVSSRRDVQAALNVDGVLIYLAMCHASAKSAIGGLRRALRDFVKWNPWDPDGHAIEDLSFEDLMSACTCTNGELSRPCSEYFSHLPVLFADDTSESTENPDELLEVVASLCGIHAEALSLAFEAAVKTHNSASSTAKRLVSGRAWPQALADARNATAQSKSPDPVVSAPRTLVYNELVSTDYIAILLQHPLTAEPVHRTLSEFLAAPSPGKGEMVTWDTLVAHLTKCGSSSGVNVLYVGSCEEHLHHLGVASSQDMEAAHDDAGDHADSNDGAFAFHAAWHEARDVDDVLDDILGFAVEEVDAEANGDFIADEVLISIVDGVCDDDSSMLRVDASPSTVIAAQAVQHILSTAVDTAVRQARRREAEEVAADILDLVIERVEIRKTYGLQCSIIDHEDVAALTLTQQRVEELETELETLRWPLRVLARTQATNPHVRPFLTAAGVTGVDEDLHLDAPRLSEGPRQMLQAQVRQEVRLEVESALRNTLRGDGGRAGGVRDNPSGSTESLQDMLQSEIRNAILPALRTSLAELGLVSPTTSQSKESPPAAAKIEAVQPATAEPAAQSQPLSRAELCRKHEEEVSSFLDHNCKHIGPRVFRCRCDGVTVSTLRLMRLHVERAHIIPPEIEDDEDDREDGKKTNHHAAVKVLDDKVEESSTSAVSKKKYQIAPTPKLPPPVLTSVSTAPIMGKAARRTDVSPPLRAMTPRAAVRSLPPLNGTTASLAVDPSSASTDWAGWRTPHPSPLPVHPLDGYADAHRMASRAMKESRMLAQALAHPSVPLDEPARELLADVAAAATRTSSVDDLRDFSSRLRYGVGHEGGGELTESASDVIRTVHDLGDVALGFMRRM